jgi:hypothetical protein
VIKKLINRLNRENQKKINRKNRTEKNQLEYFKKIPVQFGFGFVRQKPVNPNQTEPVQKKVL